MQTCAHCKLEKISDEFAFCPHCGWCLSEPFPELEKEPEPKPVTCINCEKILPENMHILNCCPFCGEYIADNRRNIDPMLISIARHWTDSTVDFCRKVLGVSARIGNKLARSKFTPIQSLAMNRDFFTAIGGLGDVAYDEFDEARKNWRLEE